MKYMRQGVDKRPKGFRKKHPQFALTKENMIWILNTIEYLMAADVLVYGIVLSFVFGNCNSNSPNISRSFGLQWILAPMKATITLNPSGEKWHMEVCNPGSMTTTPTSLFLKISS